ncbi:MAG: RluA family pseudouridine synthase [Planctomycetaceae bacterium]|nr:RluA family pseudouridine synthase [Planctomycetaceae bacterium]
MPRFTVEGKDQLLPFLKRKLPGWKTPTIKQRLKNGLVMRNDAPAVSGAEWLKDGDVVEVLAVPASPASFLPLGLGEPPLEILYADDDLLAVEKPSGLLSVASERERNITAVRLMREWLLGLDRDHDAGRELHAAHRLDREASGVLLLARSLEVKRKLAADWKRYDKTYLAVVDGFPEPADGDIDVPLWEDRGLFVRPAERGRGEAALTHYRTIRRNKGRALLEVKLGTGRKHQIRVHLATLGCPIVGDLRYGVSKAERLALHAHRLRIYHPRDDRVVEIVAPVPASFKKMLKSGTRSRS